MEKIKKFVKEEDGTQVVETALVLALVAVVAIVALQLLGTNASNLYNFIAGKITTAGS